MVIHSPWASSLLEEYGHQNLVANARKTTLIQREGYREPFAPLCGLPEPWSGSGHRVSQEHLIIGQVEGEQFQGATGPQGWPP